MMGLQQRLRIFVLVFCLALVMILIKYVTIRTYYVSLTEVMVTSTNKPIFEKPNIAQQIQYLKRVEANYDHNNSQIKPNGNSLQVINLLLLKTFGSSLHKPEPNTTSSPLQELVSSSSKPSVTAKTVKVLKSQINNNSSQFCLFPEQNPFDPLIMESFRKHPTIDCSKGTPSLIYIEGDFLVLNTTKAKLHNIEVDNCKYMILTKKKGTDYILEPGQWSDYFKYSIKIKSGQENIVVNCYQWSRFVSVTYLSRIVKRISTEKACEENYKRHVEQNSPMETMSVLLVGVDGTSRQNSIRSMPKTREFILKKLNALELSKFNEVGENTFPNVVPLLSGISVEELLKIWSFDKPLETVNDLFLWHEYKKAGYRTAMMLDSNKLTAFHFQKEGWYYPPFDYYYRPMVLHLSKEELPEQHCIGDKPEVSFLLDYWLQLATTFNNSKTPYFAYNFFMRLTHDTPHQLTAADELYLNFFQALAKRRVLNNTVLVFFSDHGARFGPVRLTQPGTMESRTPFFFMMFPPWFHTKYPDLISTFRTNQHRLTTMFDVHATLKDLLYFDGKTGKGNLRSRGISLFKEIPENRLCRHAGIPFGFCMCSNLKEINTKVPHYLSMKFVDAILQHIQEKTQPHRPVCGIMKLNSLRSVVPIRADTDCEACSYFRVTIQVTPGEGVFEAALEHNDKSDKTTVLGDAVRLTRYGEQATCVYSHEIRPYCFCI